eukprot:215476_1
MKHSYNTLDATSLQTIDSGVAIAPDALDGNINTGTAITTNDDCNTRRKSTNDASTIEGSLIDRAFTESLGNSPIYMAVFNFLAGCGVVGLPVTYKKSGITVGIAMMVFVAAISVYTLRLLIICGKRLDCEDYEKLVSKVFGRFGYYFISFSILIFDIGAC